MKEIDEGTRLSEALPLLNKVRERTASFLSNSAYALIAANWAVLNLSTSSLSLYVNKDRSVLSVLVCMVYIFITVISYLLERKHYEDCVSKINRKKDIVYICYKNTEYGQISDFLTGYIQVPLLLFAFVLFISSFLKCF